jgi:hypothetical protein
MWEAEVAVCPAPRQILERPKVTQRNWKLSGWIVERLDTRFDRWRRLRHFVRSVRKSGTSVCPRHSARNSCARITASPTSQPERKWRKQMRSACLILLLSIAAAGQTQTTNCQGTTIEVPAGQGTYTTGQANCTTTTTPAPAPAVSTQQAYEAGQNLGRGIASIRARRWVNNFCKKHAGQNWLYRNPAAGIDANGVCQSNDAFSSRNSTGGDAAARSWHTQKYCEKDGFVWRNGECHADAQTAATVQNPRQDGLQRGSGRTDPCPCAGSRDEATCRANWASVCQSK